MSEVTPDDSIDESSGVFCLHKVNDRMVLHNLLPDIIALFGLISGIYILGKSNQQRVKADHVLQINFICLGLVNIYSGTVYGLAVFGLVSSMPYSEVSILIRPAVLLHIVLPFLISWRMGL